tara:strand:+ start:13405 stop:13878 length:474 start_codon:yes stop_codon:yes gene_type:complete
MLLFVSFRNVDYTIELKRSEKKLVAEICEDVIEQDYKLHGTTKTPCCSYAIFLSGDRLDPYEMIPDSGLLSEMRVEMKEIRREHHYKCHSYRCYCYVYSTDQQLSEEKIDFFRMLDLFLLDEVRERKLKWISKDSRQIRIQNVIDSCEPWFDARMKN